MKTRGIIIIALVFVVFTATVFFNHKLIGRAILHTVKAGPAPCELYGKLTPVPDNIHEWREPDGFYGIAWGYIPTKGIIKTVWLAGEYYTPTKTYEASDGVNEITVVIPKIDYDADTFEKLSVTVHPVLCAYAGEELKMYTTDEEPIVVTTKIR